MTPEEKVEIVQSFAQEILTEADLLELFKNKYSVRKTAFRTLGTKLSLECSFLYASLFYCLELLKTKMW